MPGCPADVSLYNTIRGLEPGSDEHAAAWRKRQEHLKNCDDCNEIYRREIALLLGSNEPTAIAVVIGEQVEVAHTI